MKMKIILTAGFLFCLFVQNNVFAQQTKGNGMSDIKGVNVLNAGIGLGSYGLSGTGSIPVVASFEHGLTKNISAGVQGGFIRRTFGTDWKYTYIFAGVRASYHFNEVFKIENPAVDIYGGAGLLYRRFTVKYSDGMFGEPGIFESASGGDVVPNLHVGGRYFFSENVGGFAELGYGISPMQLGLTLKF